MIRQITAAEVINGSRQIIGLPTGSDVLIEDALLAGLLRRAGGILCPCSRTSLRAAVLEALRHLVDDEALSERVDTIIEGLIIGGDFLELHDVATADQAAKGTWVFAAPPSYVCRPRGSIFLTGIVADQDSFLPPSLASRVQYEGITRVLQPHPDEDLSGALLELGLQDLPERVWLKAPRAETPESFIQGYQRELEAQPASGEVADLSVLDPTSAVDFYPKRWTSPSSGHTGTFVARRPQEFGAPIWCLVLLSGGRTLKFIDLPSRRTRWRGSDIAWQYQMAVDRCRGTPQLFRKTETEDEVRFDFFSPLPQWSQRRMMIFGHPVPRSKCLMSFVLPSSQAEAEETFLRQRLWLEQTEYSG